MDIVHDLTLDVAVAPTRKTKVWKNRQVQWSALLDKLSTTTRTPETMAEYKAMSRDQQSDIKDVGGFVGGYCNNGNRSNVRHRSVLCLDADYADSEVWADYLLIFGNAAAAYSTHKHTPEKPRLRLVIPLARNVTPDEYQAIGRWVAYRIGIDKFDDTTYQPQRLMYWPSTSQDGAYYFEYTDGEPMQPDDVLGQYTDWSDISSWPTSSRVATVTKKTAEKQGDPTQKKGVVGAFCRAYNIHEAIAKFIPDYTPCGDGRYTYTQGSTAAGVVTYDDKFSFSHHATDPASNKLCNAWDLVRLHKYGDFDDDPDTPLTKRASYKSMTELALSDDKCKVQLIQDRMETVQTDFSEPVPESDDGTDWMTKLRYTDKGALATTIDNATIIL